MHWVCIQVSTPFIFLGVIMDEEQTAAAYAKFAKPLVAASKQSLHGGVNPQVCVALSLSLYLSLSLSLSLSLPLSP